MIKMPINVFRRHAKIPNVCANLDSEMQISEKP